MTDDIHSCSYYCERPACVRAQRDELRDRFMLSTFGAPEVLPPAPTCGCTEPPIPMRLVFYMDAGGCTNMARMDAQCPACGAVVKGLKL